MSEATKKRSRDEAAAEGETAVGAFAGAPAEAGELGYAHFWYYEDKEATQQGPFDAARMRQARARAPVAVRLARARSPRVRAHPSAY